VIIVIRMLIILANSIMIVFDNSTATISAIRSDNWMINVVSIIVYI